MMMWSGWLGALMVGLCFGAGVMGATKGKTMVQISGALLLGGYAAWREDYPVLVLAALCALSTLIAASRRRRKQRRARGVDVTLACDRFERARRAVADSVKTQSI